MACSNCRLSFMMTEHGEGVFGRFCVPPPSLCPPCRQQRRLAWRNNRTVYKRACDNCKKSFISVYSPDKSLTVYCSDCFWSDTWDATSHGRAFDFTRPFFEQFHELLGKVPLPGSLVWSSTNCDYVVSGINSKDCYLSTRVGNSEDILYSYLIAHSKGCIDCYQMYESHYCYQCIDCWRCYNCLYCQECRGCSDSAFCYDCIGCSDCFGCVGLRNKKYCFFNTQCTKEEFFEKKAQYDLGSMEGIQRALDDVQSFRMRQAVKALRIKQCENSSGDYLSECKNVRDSFDMEKVDGAGFSAECEYSLDVYDCNYIYYGENCYETVSNTRSTNCIACFGVIEGVHDAKYCMMCFNNTHDCFGCISLKRKSYCILNTQYSKEEYEKLLPRIIEQMGPQYGEFFPSALSPFCYNETVAQEYYPLTKEQVLSGGMRWKEKDAREFMPATAPIPNHIDGVADEVTKEIFACAHCTKNYKIIPQELAAYRRMAVAVPRMCPDCRHSKRSAARNPRLIWDRTCAKCAMPMQTSFAPERPETVYCEKCYLATIY